MSWDFNLTKYLGACRRHAKLCHLFWQSLLVLLLALRRILYYHCLQNYKCLSFFPFLNSKLLLLIVFVRPAAAFSCRSLSWGIVFFKLPAWCVCHRNHLLNFPISTVALAPAVLSREFWILVRIVFQFHKHSFPLLIGVLITAVRVSAFASYLSHFFFRHSAKPPLTPSACHRNHLPYFNFPI